MRMQSAERVKEDFQELGRLHVTFIRAQIKAYGSRLKLGLPMLLLGLSLSVFGLVRLFDGLAMYLVDRPAAGYFLSGGLLILASLLMLLVAALALKQTKHLAEQVIREIREDIQWMKKLI